MPRKRRSKQATLEPIREGMGLETERYRWVQTTSDVDFTMKLPEGVRGRDLIICMGPTRLTIQIKGQSEPLLDGELLNKTKVDGRNQHLSKEINMFLLACIMVSMVLNDEESYWEISEQADGTRFLHIVLAKYMNRNVAKTSMAETWWRGFLKGDPELTMAHPPSEYYSTHSE